MNDDFDMEEIQRIFVQECLDGLDVMESSLLKLNLEKVEKELINAIFRAAHSIKGGGATLGYLEISEFTHYLETLLDEIRKSETPLTENVVQILFQSVDSLRGMVDCILDGVSIDTSKSEEMRAALQSLLKSESAPNADTSSTGPFAVDATTAPYDIKEGQEIPGVSGATLVPELPFSAGGKDSSAPEKKQRLTHTDLPSEAKLSEETRSASGDPASIRVNIEKVDVLINLVGELVITQSMLARFGENFDSSQLEGLREGLVQLKRSTRELQENAMQIRMLPVRTVFNRLPRVVRDLSRQMGKQVELSMTGEDTELDKTVLEKISDPLIHLVRNCLDHGFEMPKVRSEKGKAPSGRLEISARYEGGNVIIKVKDDGAGIDKRKVLEKARRTGLLGPEEELSDERINNLIFTPGFSTAEVVSEVSGRGVGLDVVRRNIQELGGHVQVDSTEGVGSVFRIRLPLTLAILDGQLARVGNEIYIFPLISIVEALQVNPQSIHRISSHAELYRVRDQFLPVIRLARLLDVPLRDPTTADRLLVVTETDGERVGIMVDDLLAQQQVVIKSLKTNFQTVGGFTGATILGDGTVALILDVPGIVSLARTPHDMPFSALTRAVQPDPCRF